MTKKTSSVTPIFYYRIVISMLLYTDFLQSVKQLLGRGSEQVVLLNSVNWFMFSFLDCTVVCYWVQIMLRQVALLCFLLVGMTEAKVDNG